MIPALPTAFLSRLLFAAALALAFAGSAAARTDEKSREGVDVGDASAFRNLVPAEGLERHAQQQYSDMKRQAAAKRALAPDNHPQVRRLRAIAERIIPIMPGPIICCPCQPSP